MDPQSLTFKENLEWYVEELELKNKLKTEKDKLLQEDKQNKINLNKLSKCLAEYFIKNNKKELEYNNVKFILYKKYKRMCYDKNTKVELVKETLQCKKDINDCTDTIMDIFKQKIVEYTYEVKIIK
ncbi:hypothetical protein AGMMS49579_01520 [Spirochaetia bacterium]|nr:hypothetical protein AGMMS49579_01520 [Spirochaetia bacterium]